jgi:hypothetical protein
MDHLQNTIDQILAVSPAVRYVALYRGGGLTSRQRSEVSDASASESDRYEELFINRHSCGNAATWTAVALNLSWFVTETFTSLFSICMTDMFPCAWNWLPTPSTMQMRSAPSVRAHYQRQEPDTAVHEKRHFAKTCRVCPTLSADLPKC